MSQSVVPGATVTAGFGTYPKGGKHYGIDLAAPAGTPIYSLGWGTVIQAGYDNNVPSFGNHVRIKNGDYIVIYGHMRDTPLVKVGEQVKPSQKLGVVGATGNATGNHCHVEVRKGGSTSASAIDPAPFLNGAMFPGKPPMIIPGGAENPIEQAGNVITDAAGGVLGGLDAIGGFFGALGERSTWIRVIQVVGGAALVTAGVVIVGKGVIADVAVSALPGGGVLKAAAGK